MKTKILCTGSCGFIMSNLVRKLVYEKYDIVSLDKIASSSLLNNIYVHKSHQFYLADITDSHIIDRIFEYEKPDVVIHGAALTHVDDSLKDPNSFVINNVLGTQIIVNAALKYNVKKFILCSTDEVYGQLTNEKDPSWKETDPVNPRNPYSASKLSAEYVVKAAGSSFGLNYCITRSCNNYGPRQTADKFIPKVIKSIIEKKPIQIYGKGLQIRDWMHVFDNCNAIMKVLDRGENGEIYNVSAGQEFTNIEVVQLICNIMEKGWDLISYVEDRKGHDFRYSIDSSKMKSLDWKPEFKFNNGLSKIIEWYLLNNIFYK